MTGFNDTQTHDPVVTTMSGSVNYTLNAATFLEVSYGYGATPWPAARHLSICTPTI